MEEVTIFRILERTSVNHVRYIRTYEFLETAIVERNRLAADYPRSQFYIEKDTVYILDEEK